MIRKFRFEFVVLGALLLAPVQIVVANQVLEDPLERRMLEIARDLRCTVCQNQPISESNADLAQDMRQIIREQLTAGRSRDEIMQYFVDRYGDYVLMKPPVRGAGELLWVLPAMLAGVLGITAFVYLRHRRGPPLPPPPLSKKDQERVRRARDDLEP